MANADAAATTTRQVTLVGTGEALEQQAGDHQAQHRVAEKFEPLVVVGAEAAVRQRTGQQERIVEAMADAPLQCLETGVHHGREAYFDRPSYLISRNTGLISSISLS